MKYGDSGHKNKSKHLAMYFDGVGQCPLYKDFLKIELLYVAISQDLLILLDKKENKKEILQILDVD